MTKLNVARTIREGRDMLGPAATAPMTRLGGVQRTATFRAPVSRPGGTFDDEGNVVTDTRDERWHASSDNGLWAYDRIDDGATTPWRATYLPTGQYRETFGNLKHAREATAGERGLLLELRREAFTAALIEGTEQGQRWLGQHMRMSYEVSADYRCQCGGLIAQVTSDGKLGHVDACDECLPYEGQVGRGTVCPTPEAHRFCATPAPAECGHHGDDRRYGRCDLPALPNRGQGCERGTDVDCCGGCCASK